MKAADKLTFKVWPASSTLVEKDSFDFSAQIILTEASSVMVTLKFYKIGNYLVFIL